jgi:DNA-binding SARP family transcriptional activator
METGGCHPDITNINMEISQLNQLEPDYSSALDKQDLTGYLDHLSIDAIQWWFNFDIPRITLHLAPLQEWPNAQAQMPLRLAFLVEMHSGEITSERIAEYYRLFQDSRDPEAVALAVAAGYQQILDKGIDFSVFTQWRQWAEDLLLEDSGVSPLARAALLGLMGHTAIAADGDPAMAEKLFARQLSEIETARSVSLKVYHAAFRAYVLYFRGDLSSARIFLQDVLPLTNSPDCSLISRLYLQATHAFYHILSGELETALQILDEIVSHPLFNQLPPTLWLFTQSHRLLAYAYSGDKAKTENLALEIRSWSIPEYNTFYHSYLHYSLGVMALIDQEHRKVYIYAEETALLGEKCHSWFAQLMAALLKAQALSGMDKKKDALNMFEEWFQRWETKGFNGAASTAALEVANILASQNRTAEARVYYQRAKEFLPVDEPLHPLHRPKEFLQQLNLRLFSGDDQKALSWEQYPIRILTLGEFRVEIGDQVIYDRQWRGGRTKLLLKLLILHGGHKVSTSNLVDLLWPDSDGDKGYQNLKVALWRLRRLGLKKDEEPLPWLQLETCQLSLVRSLCIVDAVIFEQEITRFLKSSSVNIDDLINTLELYKGDFLTGDVSQTQIIEYRERLQQLFINGIIRLSEIVDSDELMERSLSFLIKARDLDPMHEKIHERIVRFYLQLGFPAKALQSYQHAETVLMQELGIKPGPVLASLASSIRSEFQS